MSSTTEIKELKQTNSFINNTYKKALFPCMLSILSANINVIVDGILVAQKLGNNALAAINLCMPINLVLCVIGSFVGAGSAINASKAMGESTEDAANEYYKAGFIFAYIFSLIFSIFGILFLTPICKFVCADNGIFPFVYAYSLVTIIGSIFKIMIYIPFWYLRLDGKNKEVTYIMAVLTFGNIILDVIFVFVFNGGVYGAALANVIATAFAFFMGVYYLQKDESSFSFSLKINYKHISYKKIIADGIPSSLSNLCSTFRMIIINSLFLSFGGASLVALFTAVNGVFGIGECIILGVPQASNAMLGVYVGEHDHQSCKLILKTEMVIGAICSGIFLLACVILSPFIKSIYGLNESLFLPLFLMAISIFPSLVCNILSSYYNITGKNALSSIIIFLRLIFTTYLGIQLSIITGISVFTFYIFSEITTLIFIYIYSGICHKKNNKLDRYMLYNISNEENGRVINFSVRNDKADICNASEMVSEFCENNGFNVKETMRLQLAIEEALVLISEVNEQNKSILDGFDIRAFSIENVNGIRIRYDGYDFNPFAGKMDTSEYMGINMIMNMLETTEYKRTFGVNTLILLLKDNGKNG